MKPESIRRQAKLKMQPGTYYIWVGGSCDYAHTDRASAGAYIIERNETTEDRYVTAQHHTTEFRMILTVMIHAMHTIPPHSTIVFLTNVAYIQNFDRQPEEGTDNQDLILECISAKKKHESVTVRIVSYHKFPQLPETHRMAHEAMTDIR